MAFVAMVSKDNVLAQHLPRLFGPHSTIPIPSVTFFKTSVSHLLHGLSHSGSLEILLESCTGGSRWPRVPNVRAFLRCLWLDPSQDEGIAGRI